MQFLWRLFWITFPAFSAALVNVTIDNKFGDPLTGTQFSYSPNGAWFDEPGCLTCTAHLNATFTYDGTWIEGRFNSQLGTGAFPNVVLNASVNFTGTAVYVFCILANSLEDPDGASQLTFIMDNQVVGTFMHAPNGTQGYEYDAVVYANESLPLGLHSFTLQNGQTDGSPSRVLFDYLTYSTNTTVPPHSPVSGSTAPNQSGSVKPSRGQIIGAIFGTIGASLLVALAIVFFTRKGREQPRLRLFDTRLSFKLPSHRYFRRRASSPAPPAVRHSFNPTLLVQNAAPVPPTFQRFVQHPYALPTYAYDNRISSNSAWTDTRLEPQRRQESEFAFDRNNRRTVLNIEGPETNVRPSIGISRQRAIVSEVDLSSHYDDSTDSHHSRVPTPPPPLPPPRRYTVRNK